jgi:hypothetical protein
VIDIIHSMIETAERYGLRILFIDATDVTLMARMEILPAVYIQIYRNIAKEKLNMALIIGNDRVYGVDSEGGPVVCSKKNRQRRSVRSLSPCGCHFLAAILTSLSTEVLSPLAGDRGGKA